MGVFWHGATAAGGLAGFTVGFVLGRLRLALRVFGHFAEHLGRCIYDGLWVGPKSPIPSTRGIRNDVIDALHKIKSPNLRWPGGCSADQYHWQDGVRAPEKRPRRVNIH